MIAVITMFINYHCNRAQFGIFKSKECLFYNCTKHYFIRHADVFVCKPSKYSTHHIRWIMCQKSWPLWATFQEHCTGMNRKCWFKITPVVLDQLAENNNSTNQCLYCTPCSLYRAVARTLIEGEGMYIYKFMFCPTSYFSNQIQVDQFEKKSVGQNMNTWIYTPSN